MGLLEFASDLGRRLFDFDDEAAEKIRQHIEQNNPGISELAVDFHDGTVVLTGYAATAEAMEKAVLMAGNVRGVSAVTIDALAAPSIAKPVAFYTIANGDTLSGIAKYFYGNAMKYSKIFEANREVIRDPDLIFPGQKIRIPAQI